METRGPYKRSKTTNFFHGLCKYVYLFGLPYYSFEDLDFSDNFVKQFRRLNIFLDINIYILLLAETFAFTTQKALSQEQSSNLFIFTVSHIIIWTFRIAVGYHENGIKDVVYQLAVQLKRAHNDADTEERMLRKAKFFAWGLNLMSAATVALYAVRATLAVLKGGTFTPVITIYPEVHDTGFFANVARIVSYLILWAFLFRVFALYMLIICIPVCLSHQFINVQSYFYGIEDIFSRTDLNQREKEIEYEEAYKVGIQMHSDTLLCTNKVQTVFAYVFSGQIVFNVSLLIVFMAQTMVMDRTLVNIAAIVLPASAVMISTGFVMWTSGDVTVEAAGVPTAMYFSGWHNCTGQSSLRVRKLVVISMAQAQSPVVLTGFGMLSLSYESYVTIVKTSYSVFSVIFS